MNRKVYHTQDQRDKDLTGPIICNRNDAWLGEAYYFWIDIDDAFLWGHNQKGRQVFFQIYSCDVISDNILDTVFNEEHYNFWVKVIEKVAITIIKKTYNKPTLKELNDYLKEKCTLGNIQGILFQDLPSKEYYSKVKPIEYYDKKAKSVKKRYFAYKKRIQLAVYDKEIICNFALEKTEACT